MLPPNGPTVRPRVNKKDLECLVAFAWYHLEDRERAVEPNGEWFPIERWKGAMRALRILDRAVYGVYREDRDKEEEEIGNE